MTRHRKGSSGQWPAWSAATSVTSSAVSSRMPSRTPSKVPSRASSPTPVKPFRFFDLPSELRLRIYEFILYVPKPVDLDPVNYRLLHPRMAIFLVNHRMHEEAYPVFYSQPIRLFPTHGRFFHTKKPLISRMPTHYRSVIATIELRLGPGWSNPPCCQNTYSPSLGLADCSNLRKLKVFVECDPSDTIFAGFRGKNATEETYKWFSVDLLRGVLDQVPSLEVVEIDAYPAVKKDAPLVMALWRKVEEYKKKLVWGPLRGWLKDGDEPGLIGLEKALAGMGISDITSRLVEAQA